VRACDAYAAHHDARIAHRLRVGATLTAARRTAWRWVNPNRWMSAGQHPLPQQPTHDHRPPRGSLDVRPNASQLHRPRLLGNVLHLAHLCLTHRIGPGW
jgi:hypothetical protein